MCVVWFFILQSELLSLFGGNVCYWVFEVAMCVVGSFRWQCVLLYVLCGKGFVKSFKWQSEFLVLLSVKENFGSLRCQSVLLGLLGGNVCCCRF